MIHRHLPRLFRLQSLQARGDRGSATAAVLLFVPLFLLLASFVIDLGGEISQREHATDLAEQAARYAAQNVDTTTLRSTGTAVIDPSMSDCNARVQQFATSSGLSTADASLAHCTTLNGNTVTVSIQISYSPILLGTFVPGGTEVTGTGSAEALTAAQ